MAAPILKRQGGIDWPWFKKAQQEYESAAADAAAAQAAAAAASAAEAAAKAQAQAEEELAKQAEAMSEAQRQKLMTSLGIMQKLQEAHRQQVNLAWQRRSSMLDKVRSEAEEMLDMWRERRSQEKSQKKGSPVEFLGMKRKGVGLVETRWDTILPPAAPKVVVLDLAIACSITPECMSAAMRLAGLSGTHRQAGVYVELASIHPYAPL